MLQAEIVRLEDIVTNPYVGLRQLQWNETYLVRQVGSRGQESNSYFGIHKEMNFSRMC